MFVEHLKRTGRTSFLIFPVLIILFSCSTFDPKVNQAIARRSLQAATDAGAETSKCASRDFYEAERTLRIGERALSEKKVVDTSDDYFISATSLAEKAEEEALFCEK